MNKKFTKEKIIEGLKQLTKALGTEPTAHQIDDCDYLPTARQIQRQYGGLKSLRKEAGLHIINHNQGALRREKALRAAHRASKYEQDIVMKLIKKHHDNENFTKDVIREFAYQHYIESGKWYKNIKCDVAIVDRINQHVTMFDLFYPQDIYSFGGCVAAKAKKLINAPVSLIPPYTHDVIFVCVNEQITQQQIDKVKVNKAGARVLSYQSFKEQYL